MIDPYKPDPAHSKNPVKPVTLPGTDITMCGCDPCVNARQDWTDRQPPLLAELDPNDGEDNDEHNQADVLVRRAYEHNVDAFWIDVQTPNGVILHNGGHVTYPETQALERARALKDEWAKKGYVVEIVFDGNVVN